MSHPVLFACIGLAMLAGLSAPAGAGTRLPSIFGDHMVLQRGEKTPIWGTAPPGQKIRVEFAGSTATTTTTDDGRWRVSLNLPEPNASGATLTVTGDEIVEFSDVLIGDVWLASGQSNMAMTVGKSEGRDEAIAGSADPLLRCIVIRPSRISPLKPLDECRGEWRISGPETVGGVSAAGYYFVRHLREELGDLPVGLVQSSWGGTLAEQWTSREALESHPETRPLWEEFQRRVDRFDPASATPPEVVAKLMAEWRAGNIEARRNRTRIPKLPEIVGDPAKKRYSPCNQFNTMIHPLIPFAVRGFVWYQGEGNRERAEQYETLLPVMIADWRKRWDRPEAPFYIVQLANTGKPAAPDTPPAESAWAELQWAQFRVARETPHSGLAVINDGNDTSLHPREKRKVGERLALLALADEYGKTDGGFSGPLFREAAIEGNAIRLFFDHAEGLRSSDGGPLRHFQIAAADRNWVRAEARIVDGTVLVSSESIPNPVAVRYAWRGAPRGANLTNASGLPASLFRTDDWPVLSSGKLLPEK